MLLQPYLPPRLSQGERLSALVQGAACFCAMAFAQLTYHESLRILRSACQFRRCSFIKWDLASRLRLAIWPMPMNAQPDSYSRRPSLPLSYLLDCRLVFVSIFVFSSRYIGALSEGQEVCVLRRKHKVLDKPKPIGIQTPAHHSATVLLHKIREIIRIDDSLFDIGCFHNPALQPTVIDPLLDLVNSDVQRFREAIWCKPISPSLGAFPQTVQHGPNGTRRTLHDF